MPFWFKDRLYVKQSCRAATSQRISFSLLALGFLGCCCLSSANYSHFLSEQLFLLTSFSPLFCERSPSIPKLGWAVRQQSTCSWGEIQEEQQLVQLQLSLILTCIKYSSSKQSTQGSATSIGRTSLEMSQHFISTIFSWKRIILQYCSLIASPFPPIQNLCLYNSMGGNVFEQKGKF